MYDNARITGPSNQAAAIAAGRRNKLLAICGDIMCSQIMKYLSAIFLVLLIGACNKKDSYTSENEVYESVFLYVVGDAVTQIYISRDTDASYLNSIDLASLKGQLIGFPRELLEGLVAKHDHSKRLLWSPIMVKAEFVDISKIDRKSNIQSFYRVSNVEFDESQTKAIVLLGYTCPALCGASDTLLYLEKSDKVWKMQKVFRFWIS